MNETELKEYEKTQKEYELNQVWLQNNQICRTEKEAKEKTLRLKTDLEYMEVLRPLRIQHESHLKSLKAAKQLKVDQAVANDGLKEIEALYDLLSDFSVVGLKYLQPFTDEVRTNMNKRKAVLSL